MLFGLHFSCVFSNKEHTTPEEKKWPKLKFAEKLLRGGKTLYWVIPLQMPTFIPLRAERDDEELTAVKARQRRERER